MDNAGNCWTCRIRRKKCDAAQPICNSCAALGISCHRGPERPAWMDGGAKQQEMAAQLKLEVRANGPRRRETRSINFPAKSITLPSDSESTTPSHAAFKDLSNLSYGSDLTGNGSDHVSHTSVFRFGEGHSVTNECSMDSSGWPNHILLMFYLDTVFPFLFPFYRPSLLQEGGRAWILNMMVKSPVIRQALLCQSSLFFSLMQGVDGLDTTCEKILGLAADVFASLRGALQVRLDEGVPELPHCTVRLLATVTQLQRVEVATLNFANCQQHLNAGLELFQRLLDNSNALASVGRFNAVLGSLGSSFYDPKVPSMQYLSAEQAAFRFSSALLILDDIIASTVLQEHPKLLRYHDSILGDTDTRGGTLQLELIIGCQNWVFIELGKIATLDAWKQRCQKAGALDAMELVHQATSIQHSLQEKILRLEISPSVASEKGQSMFEALVANLSDQPRRSSCQTSVITRIWAHAALIYLSVVVSGWQPASLTVRNAVGTVVDLLTHQLQPPALLRTVVWPLCVAGCLADRTHEHQIRGLVEALQPRSVFGTVRKAFEIMENIWSSKDSVEIANRDLAMCFRSQGDLVLLV